MRYLARQPPSPLGALVEYLWELSDQPGHARERIVPSATVELVINLHADAFRVFDPVTRSARRLRGAIVSGCYTRAFEIDTRAHALVIGVHFKPGGAARLLGVPPGAFANAHVGLEDLWGRAAVVLRERLCAAPTSRQRLELLERALIARLPADGHPRGAVTSALTTLERPGIEVGRVAQAVGLSRRRFIEIFTEDVGMPPKRYSMIRRFQRALVLALRSPSAAWARIALECGYYDQAHLCRDWLDLAGVTPAELVGLQRIPVKQHHVAVPGAGSNLSNTRPRHAR